MSPAVYTCDLGLYKTNGVVDFNKIPKDGNNSILYKRNNPEGAKFVAVMTDGAPSLKYEVAMSEQARRAGLKAGDVVCAFKPKVQVMDNWGWCSGRCAKRYNANGNPEDDQATLQDESALSDGCYDELKSTDGNMIYLQCTNPIPNKRMSPWIEYSKNIIVIP